MKLVTRALLAGAGTAAVIALSGTPALAAAPASAPAATAEACSASSSGSTVSGTCTIDTPVGTFGATFNGTIGADGMASGDISFKGGPVGDMAGTWSGGPFTGGPATINYTVQTPAGPVSGSFEIPVN